MYKVVEVQERAEQWTWRHRKKKKKKKRDVRGIRLAAKQIAGNYRNTTFFSTFHSL